jgi:spermidine synthase
LLVLSGVAAMLFVTGACGLVYQQLWLRELSLVFGVTVYAAATVLGAFMAGLALGSWLAGRLIDRARRPLVWFGICEALVGVAALVTPSALDVVEDVYVSVSGGPETPLGILTLARLVLTFAVLLLPATLMGASMPIVVRAAVSHSDQLGSRTALLYSVNTAGAIVGTLLAGFVLIGEYGVWATFKVAAIGNLTIGTVAVLLGCRLGARGAGAACVGVPTRADREHWVPSLSTRGRRAVLTVFVVSGFVSLALEIVWFRVLVLYLESNAYAFSAMLATVLAGIAFGSAVITPFLRRRRDWFTVLVGAETLLALVALTSLAFLAESYDLVDLIGAEYEEGTVPSGRFTAVASLLVVFPAAMVMGIAFPIGVLLWGATGPDARDAGHRVGCFYAGNLAGAIAGSLAAGFVLVPWLGTRGSIVALSGMVLGSVVLLIATEPAPGRLVIAGIGAVAFVVAAALLVPDPFAAALEHRYPGATVEWAEEGVQTTVSVHSEPGGVRRMYLDGLPQASTAPEVVALHRLIGALPVVLHEDPRHVLVIGLGGGVTAGSAAATEDARVHVVELSEEVIDGARFFERVNEGINRRRNVEFRVDDGRNYLLLTDRKFDVITADIIQPQHAGAGKVWSVEYWRLVRDALADDGIVLQWVGADRPEPVYKMIVRSFLEVFPDATLWADGQLLVGTKQPLRLDRDALRAELAEPEFAAARARAGITSIDALLALYTAGPKQLQRFVGGGPLLTDDRPRIEYYRSLPKGAPPVDLGTLRGNVAALLR